MIDPYAAYRDNWRDIPWEEIMNKKTKVYTVMQFDGSEFTTPLTLVGGNEELTAFDSMIEIDNPNEIFEIIEKFRKSFSKLFNYHIDYQLVRDSQEDSFTILFFARKDVIEEKPFDPDEIDPGFNS